MAAKKGEAMDKGEKGEKGERPGKGKTPKGKPMMKKGGKGKMGFGSK